MWICLLLVSPFLVSSTEAFCPTSCLCEENSPVVRCVGAHLNVVPSLLNPYLKRLNLAHNTIRNINDVLQYYEHMEHLDFSHNHLNSLGEDNFRQQTVLQDLNLSSNNLTKLSPKTFHGLESLFRLDLSHNSLTDINPDSFLYAPKLRSLLLAKNRLHTLHPNTFQGVPNLQTLDLCENIFRAIPKTALKPLMKLETLDLCRNRLTHIKANDLPTESLLALSVGSNSIMKVSLNAFKDSPRLVSLNLNDNLLEEIPSKAFYFLPNLESLHLSRNKFSVIRDGGFVGLKSLLVLEISKCPLLEGIEPTALLHCQRLNTLILSDNPLLTYLPTNIFSQLSSLRVLNLKADGLGTLSEETVPLKSLKSLDIRDNPVSCNCSIFWLWDALNSLNRTVDISDVVCTSPDNLRGVYLSRARPGQLACEDPLIQVIMCLSAVCLSSALILGLFVVVWRYRRRPHLDKLRSNCGWVEGPLRPMESPWLPDDGPQGHILVDEYFYHTFPTLRKVPVTEV